MSEFNDGFLSAVSTPLANVRSQLRESFDLALFSPSWDQRSLCSLDASISIDYALMFQFTATDELGLQTAHSEKTVAFLQKTASLREILTIDALRLRESWDTLWGRVIAYADTKKRPLKIFVDLTTCPRYYSLGLIAGCFQLGIAEKITVFYSEGIYSRPGGSVTVDYPFSFGHWKTVPVPFLQGVIKPGRDRHFLVSVGFEGSKTARVLTKADPDHVSLLFPNPGVKKGYAAETLRQNARIITDYRISKRDIIKTSAADAIAAWKSLSEAGVASCLHEELSYLSCGTKPHALAMSLRAMCLRHPAVLYNLPERHNFVDVVPNGQHWRFDITDKSSIR
jgi:hypothetical protein